MYIKDTKPGDTLDGYYLLKSVYAKRTAGGKPFLSIELTDCSGTVEGKVWDYSGPISPADTGAVVRVTGTVGEFRGAPQVTVEQIRLAGPDDRYDIQELVPTAPLDAQAALQELRELIGSIQDGDYRRVCAAAIERLGDRFVTLPAAKSVHHGFRHGLLMHTLYMARTADFLAGLYSSVIDRSLLLAGTILHDMAKCREFVTSPLGLVTEYSLPGQLLGHLVMGAQEVAKLAEELAMPEEKSLLLQHMLLSHHGEPEYGAAVRPACAESELLSYIDMIDSRMEIYREQLESLPAGQFSGRIPALDRRIYHHN